MKSEHTILPNPCLEEEDEEEEEEEEEVPATDWMVGFRFQSRVVFVV
jgi:hypothetical protein